MTNEAYHGGPGISSSGVKLLLEATPLHYWHAYLNPSREKREQSKAFLLGSAFHTKTLEPENFDKEYAAVPDDLTRSSKDGRALYAEIEDSGRSALKVAEITSITAMADAIRGHEYGKVLFKTRGKVEQSIFWVDPDTGALCKVRPDFLIRPCKKYPNGLLFDLKSSDDASPEGFKKSAYNYGYHISAAMYREGFQRHFKTKEKPPFVFGVVEKDAPFAVAFYEADEQFLMLGEMKFREGLELYAECAGTNWWPGYEPKPQKLGLPYFALKELDNQEIEVAYVDK